jgi:hypothetical protein
MIMLVTNLSLLGIKMAELFKKAQLLESIVWEKMCLGDLHSEGA